MSQILVVDDEAEVRAVLRDCFEIEGYEVHEADCSEAMSAVLSANPIDLITLDLNLGQEDGLSLARDIQAQHDIPIIMITGKGDMIDKIVGLEVGADDYITKPFHLREVLARTRSVLRRAHNKNNADPIPPTADPSSNAQPRFAFAQWVFDPNARALFNKNGEETALTTAEFDLLHLFVERPQRVLSRDAIMDALKGHDWSPLDRSIDTLVARLRKKIESGSGDPKLIKTVRGAGYTFTPDVVRV